MKLSNGARIENPISPLASFSDVQLHIMARDFVASRMTDRHVEDRRIREAGVARMNKAKSRIKSPCAHAGYQGVDS
jgi:hypothetical protein